MASFVTSIPIIQTPVSLSFLLVYILDLFSVLKKMEEKNHWILPFFDGINQNYFLLYNLCLKTNTRPFHNWGKNS